MIHLGASACPFVQSFFGATTDTVICFSYVWICLNFTTDADKACTYIKLAVQSKSDDAHSCFVRDTSDSYHRYLLPSVEPQREEKITDVCLLRTTGAAVVPPGYNGMTIDINQGRGGSWLYLIWKTVAVPQANRYVSGFKVRPLPSISPA